MFVLALQNEFIEPICPHQGEGGGYYLGKLNQNC